MSGQASRTLSERLEAVLRSSRATRAQKAAAHGMLREPDLPSRRELLEQLARIEHDIALEDCR